MNRSAYGRWPRVLSPRPTRPGCLMVGDGPANGPRGFRRRGKKWEKTSPQRVAFVLAGLRAGTNNQTSFRSSPLVRDGLHLGEPRSNFLAPSNRRRADLRAENNLSWNTSLVHSGLRIGSFPGLAFVRCYSLFSFPRCFLFFLLLRRIRTGVYDSRAKPGARCGSAMSRIDVFTERIVRRENPLVRRLSAQD